MKACRRCGAPVEGAEVRCQSCGAPADAAADGGPEGLASSFGAEHGAGAERSRRRRRRALAVGTLAAVALAAGAVTLRPVERGRFLPAVPAPSAGGSPRPADGAVGGARPEVRGLRERFPQTVGDYSLASVRETVTEDLRRDSLEALAASYTAGAGRQVTYVLASYPTAERARQSLEAKVKSMREGAISRAAVAERAARRDAAGRVAGERVLLSTAVLEQVVWTEGSLLGMVTSRAGRAVEFEQLLGR